MGNKTKPSSLLLVPSHDDFKNPGVLFTKEMLEWPIFSSIYSRELDRAFIIISRNAIEGLMNIGPFSAKISLEVDLINKKLSLPQKTWGKIYLNSDYVLSFSHHSTNNEAFRYIVEWPELNFEHDHYAVKFYTWDANKWAEFFLERIKQESIDLEAKAKSKRNDAIALENRAVDIRLAFFKK